MSTEPETPITAPAVSKGVFDRIAAKLGIRTETDIIAGLNDEIALITAAANDAQAEVEVGKAEIARQNSLITGLQAKVSALDTVVPGITGSANPAELLTQTITRKTADQVAAMGLPPGGAPGTEPTATGADDKSMSRADFDKLDHSARNTFITNGGKLTN